MKALLINPLIPDTFWNFRHVMKFIRKKAAHVPLGLLTVAAMFPGEWDIKVVDMNTESLSDEVIEWADLIFIGAMMVQKESVRQIIARCRTLGKAIVGGGPLFTSYKDDFNDVDYLVLNEAEITLPLFLKDLANGSPRRIYTTEEKPDINLTPLPRWDLIDINIYASMSVQYSRGCPYDCEFCDITNLYGRYPRLKSNEQMIREFDRLYEIGWRGSLFIVDDNFIGNKSKVKTLLRELKSWQETRKFPFMLYTEASVNLAQDEKLMKLMTEAGFDAVFLGLETPEEKCFAECSKHQNRSVDLVEAVKTIQRNGMEVMGGFIIGFDSDPPDIFERQIKFIQNSGVVRAMIGLLNALPGTRLYQRLKEEGRLIDDCSGDNCDGTMNFTSQMDPRTLKEGYNKVINYIYSPKEYYARILEFLATYRPVRHRPMTLLGIIAFLNSVLYVGILEKWSNSIYFWKLLFKTMIFYRRSLREAVMLMMFGYHFRKLLIQKANVT
ncbi:MAG: B12-binding domain-containing radical SAM protein [Smithella sp.]|nr:B12-binding domain-containing radical SAM protein [Smithella sp.]